MCQSWPRRVYRSLNPDSGAQTLWTKFGQNLPNVGVEDIHYYGKVNNSNVDTLLVGIDGLLQVNRQLIVDLATKQRLAAIYPSKEFTDVGGLMAYGVSYPDLYFRSATFIDKIFRGAKAGDLPVEQPTKLELIINLAAAKALGLTVPPSLITRADEIIE